MILDKIVKHKRLVLQKDKVRHPLHQLFAQLDHIEKSYGFKEALAQHPGLSIIGEVKRASPSKGRICKNFNHLDIANEYRKHRVQAISVLTEEKHFRGHNQYLKDIAEMVPDGPPLLRKDFIIDDYQIYQAKTLGADAILLIVAILSTEELTHFIKIARGLNMDCLVEVHNQEEINRAVQAGATIIGINNRNLKTFTTSLDHTKQLIQYIPKDKLIVSESGIKTREDMQMLEGLGVHAVLIGETLMKADSIREKLEELRGY